MNTWRVAQNTSASFTATLDASQAPYPYAGTEPLLATVWAGDDSLALWTTVPTWISGSAGTMTVNIPAANTAGMTPGYYRVMIALTYNGATADVGEALLEIVYTAGAALARPQYITIRDLRNTVPWIDDLQDTEWGQAGFADQLADAREWLDENILRQYRGGNISLLGYHGLALDAWYTGGVRRTSLTNIWLLQQLAANTLIVRPRIKKILAHYAAYLIARAQINSPKYLAMAAMEKREATTLLVSSVAELNLNGDGVTPNVPISFTSTNTLFG